MSLDAPALPVPLPDGLLVRLLRFVDALDTAGTRGVSFCVGAWRVEFRRET